MLFKGKDMFSTMLAKNVLIDKFRLGIESNNMEDAFEEIATNCLSMDDVSETEDAKLIADAVGSYDEDKLNQLSDDLVELDSRFYKSANNANLIGVANNSVKLAHMGYLDKNNNNAVTMQVLKNDESGTVTDQLHLNFNGTDFGLIGINNGKSKTAKIALSSDLNNLFRFQETLYEGSLRGGQSITLANPISNYKALRVVATGNDGVTDDIIITTNTMNILANATYYSNSAGVMVLLELALTTSDGLNYVCQRNSQMNLSASGVSYFNPSSASAWKIVGIK